jgi:hypothetical protein
MLILNEQMKWKYYILLYISHNLDSFILSFGAGIGILLAQETWHLLLQIVEKFGYSTSDKSNWATESKSQSIWGRVRGSKGRFFAERLMMIVVCQIRFWELMNCLDVSTCTSRLGFRRFRSVFSIIPNKWGF